MRFASKIAAAMVAAAAAFATAAYAATIGGVYYAVQYDYREFFAATDGKPFQVIIEGNPFPSMDTGEVARQLLPVMQAAKPMPRLTFTYDAPAEKPRPDYRLVLVFDYANDLRADAVCEGTRRTGPGTPGVFKVFAIYCRNDMSMSQTTAWTPATGPDDPRINWLFRELFMVVFNDAESLRRQNGFDRQ
ncbi:MAG: hypothetical protein A3D94_20455 [Alphaproteobacteria bacterium RIFCSPHIGHO2_12_FULL_66_14]|nr:MAG: hypothetical protein A3D94_20455 [Alphaproteobacteria bacterium RIFCSPHIGHO2_12_FULL_66_14]